MFGQIEVTERNVGFQVFGKAWLPTNVDALAIVCSDTQFN